MPKYPTFPKYDEYPWEDRRTPATKYFMQLTSQSKCGPVIAETGSGNSAKAARESAFRALARANDYHVTKCKSKGTHNH